MGHRGGFGSGKGRYGNSYNKGYGAPQKSLGSRYGGSSYGAYGPRASYGYRGRGSLLGNSGLSLPYKKTHAPKEYSKPSRAATGYGKLNSYGKKQPGYGKYPALPYGRPEQPKPEKRPSGPYDKKPAYGGYGAKPVSHYGKAPSPYGKLHKIDAKPPTSYGKPSAPSKHDKLSGAYGYGVKAGPYGKPSGPYGKPTGSYGKKPASPAYGGYGPYGKQSGLYGKPSGNPYSSKPASLPYGKPGSLPYGKPASLPYGKSSSLNYGLQSQLPKLSGYGKSAIPAYGKLPAYGKPAGPYGKPSIPSYGQPYGKPASLPYGKSPAPAPWESKAPAYGPPAHAPKEAPKINYGYKPAEIKPHPQSNPWAAPQQQ